MNTKSQLNYFSYHVSKSNSHAKIEKQRGSGLLIEIMLSGFYPCELFVLLISSIAKKSWFWLAWSFRAAPNFQSMPAHLKYLTQGKF